MPNIATRSIEYTSEVTGNTGPINFRISRDFIDSSLAQNLGFNPKQDAVCAFPIKVEPRYLSVLFRNKRRIKFPVGSRVQVARQVAAAAQLEGAVCVDYYGERWVNIPGIGDPSKSYSIEDSVDSLNGAIIYSSDALGGNIAVNYSLEQDIEEFISLSNSCAGRPDTGAICDTAFDGFKPRRLIITVKNSGNLEQEKSAIVRRIPIVSAQDIQNCLRDAGLVGNCIGYEGEICPKANLFVDSSGGGNGAGNLPPFVLPPILRNLLPG